MDEQLKSRGAGNQQVGRAGEYFAVAEMHTDKSLGPDLLVDKNTSVHHHYQYD